MRPNPPLLQQIMPMPKASVSLPPKEENWRRRNHRKADAAKHIKHLLTLGHIVPIATYLLVIHTIPFKGC